MTGSVDQRRTRARAALGAVLTALMLAPAGVLATRVWDDITDRRESTRLEQRGVEYLAALSPLVSALAEAQSSALSGVAGSGPSVAAAVDGVAAADRRLGGDLRTRERWAGLRQRIEELPEAGGGPLAVYRSHVEVTDLTLALYDTVRTNAELWRDPDNDVSHLQQAVAVDLPTTVVQVSRMGDLSRLVADAGAAQRAELAPQFGAAVLAVNTHVATLTDNLQAAVDDTGSTTLSGNLVSGLDTFRRGVEALTRGANPGGAPDPATMATAQSQLQISLANLAGIVVRETAGLLDDRLGTLDTRRTETIAMAALLVLLAVAALVLPWTGRRRPAPPVSTPEAEAVTAERELSGALR